MFKKFLLVIQKGLFPFRICSHLWPFGTWNLWNGAVVIHTYYSGFWGTVCPNCNYAPKSYEFSTYFLIKRTRIQQTTCRAPQGFPPVSCTAHSPLTSWSPPGSPRGEEGWKWKWLKERISTFILLSRRARRPASVQIALMSAPERSSLKLNCAQWFLWLNWLPWSISYLGHNVLFKVNILSQGHFPWQKGMQWFLSNFLENIKLADTSNNEVSTCVDPKDSALGLLIWEWELNFPGN